MEVVGQPMLVLNTHKVASDLLNRRAGVYSDRPTWIGQLLVPSTPRLNSYSRTSGWRTAHWWILHGSC
jgi:hypothetical protein